MELIMLEAIKGIVRALLGAAAGYVVAKGWLDADMANEVIGAVLLIMTAGWSVFDKKTAEVKLQKAVSAPEGKSE